MRCWMFDPPVEHVLLYGVSPRSKPGEKTLYHAVVGKPKVGEPGFEIVHDPHPGGGGFVGPPWGVGLIVPLGKPENIFSEFDTPTTA